MALRAFHPFSGSPPFIIVINASGAIADGYLIKQAGTTVYTTKEVPEKFLSTLQDYNEQLKEKYAKQDAEDKAGGKTDGGPGSAVEGEQKDEPGANSEPDVTPDDGGTPPPEE